MFLAVEEPISWSDSPNESDDETHDPRRYPHLVCGAGGDRSLAELTRHSDGLVTERDDCGVGRLLGIDHVGPCRYIDEEENMPFRFEEMVFIIQDDKLRFIQSAKKSKFACTEKIENIRRRRDNDSLEIPKVLNITYRYLIKTFSAVGSRNPPKM